MSDRANKVRLAGTFMDADGRAYVLVNDDAGTGGSIVWKDGQTIQDILHEMDERFGVTHATVTGQ